MYKTSILFTLTFFFSLISTLYSNGLQNIYLDSLYAQIEKLPEDSIKVLELTDLSFNYMKHQLDTANIIGNKALKLSEKLNYEYGIAKSLFQLGLVLRYQSDYEKSIDYCKRSFNLFDKMNKTSDKARALNSLGNVYKRKGDYKASVENFLGSLKIYSEINDSIKVSFVMNNLGILYQEMGEYEESLDYHVKNLEVRKKLGMDKEYVLKTLMNIGAVYNEILDYSKALLYYNEAINLIDDHTSKYNQLLLLQSMGTIYQAMEQYKNAKQYYLKALKLEEELGEKNHLISTLLGLSAVSIKEGNKEKSIDYLYRAEKLAKEQGNLRRRIEVVKCLSGALYFSNDFKNSLLYHELYHKLSDSLLGLERIRQITELEQKYKAEKREQQIAFLEKEKEIQKLELSKKTIEAEKKNYQRNALIIIVILSLSLMLYYVLDNKKRKKINLLLALQNKRISDQRIEIAKQNDALIESNSTKDKLFQIIAHDLRSPIVSMESITQLIPYWVEEQDFESLQKLSNALEMSVHNVLSLIDNLLNWALNQQGKFPFNPEKLNLIENIKESISVYLPIAKVKKINIYLEALNNITVYADKNMLFTVMRNLLNNAIKFTPENGEITVGCEQEDHFIKVWVKDSGIGIPQEKKEFIFEIAGSNTKGTEGELGKGLGLFFCKEFVNLNNGEIYVESDQSKGTKIVFTLPLYKS